MSLIMMVMMMTTTIFFGPRDDALDLIPSSIFSHTLGTPTVRVGLSWKISFLLQEAADADSPVMLDVLEQCALQGVLVRKVADSPRWDHVVDVHHHPQDMRLGECRCKFGYHAHT